MTFRPRALDGRFGPPMRIEKHGREISTRSNVWSALRPHHCFYEMQIRICTGIRFDEREGRRESLQETSTQHIGLDTRSEPHEDLCVSGQNVRTTSRICVSAGTSARADESRVTAALLPANNQRPRMFAMKKCGCQVDLYSEDNQVTSHSDDRAKLA